MAARRQSSNARRSIFLAMQEFLEDSTTTSDEEDEQSISSEEGEDANNETQSDLIDAITDELGEAYLEEYLEDVNDDLIHDNRDLYSEGVPSLDLEDMDDSEDESSSSSTYWFRPPPNVEIFRLCKSESVCLDELRNLVDQEGIKLLALRDDEEHTPLYYLGCDQDVNLEILEYLSGSTAGASVLGQIPRPQALSTLMEAFSTGVMNLETLKVLMRPLNFMNRDERDNGENDTMMEDWLSLDPLHETIARQKAKDDTILFLIESSPNAAERGNWEGRLPLHLACLHGCSLSVVQALVEHYPASLLLPDVDGDLPLHLALSPMALKNQANQNDGDTLGVIRYILEQSPNSLTQGNDSMQLPIHVACESGAGLECIQLLQSRAPESMERQCMSGLYPLHCACSRRHGKSNSASVILFLIDLYPSAVRHADEDGDLPLHILLRRGEMPKEEDDQHFELVQKLLSIYPDAIAHANDEEDLPIHVSCEYSSSLRLVKKLVELNEAGLEEFGEGGALPLHRVCGGTSKRLGIIEFILDKYPDAVEQADDDDDLPIHLLLRGMWGAKGGEDVQKRKNLVVRMLDLFEDCTYFTNEDDLSPFSLACKWGAPPSVVQLLHDEDDEPVLHRLLRESSGSASLQTVQYVTSLYPESIYEKNDSGETPLHAAARMGFGLSVLQALYNRNRCAIFSSCAGGNLPLHSSVLGSPSSATIAFLWNKYKAAAAIANYQGSLPMHLVCSSEYPGFFAEIRLVCEMNLEALKRPDRSGRVPLHHYCERSRNSSKALLYLVNQNPATCGFRDNEGNLPLHLCAMNRTGYSLAVQHLVNKNKQALAIRNDDGYLPMHLYIMHRVDHELTHLKSLSQRADKCLEYRTSADGQTFLHTAVRCGLVKDVIKFLIECDPDGPKIQDSQGRTPLHLARDYSAAFLLFCNYPDAVSTRDHQGNLPIHRACALRDGALGVLRCLWVCDPTCVRARNNDKDLPIHVACENRSSRDVLEFLSEQSPESLGLRGSRGQLPVHAWFRRINVFPRYSDPDVFFLISKYPEGLEVLDDDGFFPFQLASGGWSIGTIFDLLTACPSVVNQQHQKQQKVCPESPRRSFVECKGSKRRIGPPQRKRAVPIKMSYVEAAKQALKTRPKS